MIYLDSAATTLQKPQTVPRAACCAIRNMTTPGRGGYPAAAAGAAAAFRCREEAAELFDVPSPEQVVFTSSATHGLNIAIRTLVKPGDTVLISGYEHNAVTRTLCGMEGVSIKIANAPLFDRAGILAAFRAQMTGEVSTVITTHVSNVFGFILPVEEIAALCAAKKMPLIVDASQSAGSVPLSFRQLGAEFVAMPGHKGLYGPQGTGLLLCSGTAEPLFYGGTGSASRLQTMPEFLPDRLEAGTQNMPGIAGLAEGLRFVRRKGVARIGSHEQHLIGRMAAALERIEGIEVFAASAADSQAGVLSFRHRRIDCEELGDRLARRGIAVRAGLHCAPLAHQSAGTLESGTVRASVSAFTSMDAVSCFIREMNRICG